MRNREREKETEVGERKRYVREEESKRVRVGEKGEKPPSPQYIKSKPLQMDFCAKRPASPIMASHADLTPLPE